MPMHSQTVYVKFVSASMIGTVYTCMNSWKEAFNPYNSFPYFDY